MQFVKALAPLALFSLVSAAVTTLTKDVTAYDHTTLVTITSCESHTCTEVTTTLTTSVAIATTVVTSTAEEEIITLTTRKASTSSSDEITYVDVTTTPTVTISTKASTDITTTPTLFTTYNSNATTHSIQQYEGSANQLQAGLAVAGVAFLLI